MWNLLEIAITTFTIKYFKHLQKGPAKKKKKLKTSLSKRNFTNIFTVWKCLNIRHWLCVNSGCRPIWHIQLFFLSVMLHTTVMIGMTFDGYNILYNNNNIHKYLDLLAS